MSADDWLRTQVKRALSVGDPARYPELVGAVEALAATGALSAEVAQDARDQLDEAFVPGAARSDAFGYPHAPPSGSTLAALAAPQAEELVAVFAPVVPLAEADGLEVVLLAVELWTSVVIVRLAGVGSAQDAHGAAGATTVAWGVWSPGPLPDGVPPAPPPPPNTALLHVPVSLSDEVGTRYATTRGMAAGDAPLRAEKVFAPGVPVAARWLAVTVPEQSGQSGSRVQLELPERS